ncbi:pancreatic lipase-related protein 3 [Chelonia mydas]|uniref:pancreatic lipase-related protein 3 n=1 Tax=Chelonia mydas TaxID=8469 RepID=UPI001CA7EF7A|nr:pancreatic lipase-related protein 3 [Chelonia mydas]
MVMFTSDVASVMLGRLNGVAAQLKRDIPHLVQQHCIAHREVLGISDAWKEVKLIRDIETLMRTVHTVFCWSSRRKCKFQEIVDASECESVAIRPLNEVRWLSRHFALRAIICNYNPLLEYFEQDKDTDPVSKYCHKKLNTMEYRITLEVMKDVLSELASLSTLLQNGALHLLKHFTSHELLLQEHFSQQLMNNKILLSECGEKVCYPRLGCFSDKPPWAGIPGRFLGGLPDSPESMNISFTLYTKETRNNSQVISAIHPSTIKDSHFCSHRKTRFIVHGFMSTGKRGWVVKMCLLLVEVEDVNCIAVDWAEGAKGLYISAVNNIRVVGAEIAYFINTLMKMFRYCPSHIHIIGHSLGAHVAGEAGRRIRGIKRITGLDPAGPLFEGTPPKVRLDPTDARFVDVIHSNAAQFPTVGVGIVNTSGHLDFYPNGGSIMPGCDDVIIPVTKKGWSHKISIKLSGTTKVRGELNIVFHGTDKFTKQYQIICGLLHQGNIYSKYVDVEINPRNITKIEFLWNKNIFTLLWAQLGAEMVHIINEEDGHV